MTTHAGLSSSEHFFEVTQLVLLDPPRALGKWMHHSILPALGAASPRRISVGICPSFQTPRGVQKGRTPNSGLRYSYGVECR